MTHQAREVTSTTLQVCRRNRNMLRPKGNCVDMQVFSTVEKTHDLLASCAGHDRKAQKTDDLYFLCVFCPRFFFSKRQMLFFTFPERRGEISRKGDDAVLAQ